MVILAVFGAMNSSSAGAGGGRRILDCMDGCECMHPAPTQARLRRIATAIAVALLQTACGPVGDGAFSTGGSDRIVAPLELPTGTRVRTDRIGLRVPNKFVLVLVSDCGSGSATALRLAQYTPELPRFVITLRADLLRELRKEWSGTTVGLDRNRQVLPEFAYAITPRLVLVENGVIADSALGAAESREKWKEWNR